MIIQGTAITGTTVSSSAATVDADSYFNLVSLLLPGNGTNGSQNNTFLDSSTNNLSITRNGNPTQGTFSPFSQTGWSNYFDGTGDYLTLSSNTSMNFGTGNFTIEGWFYTGSKDISGGASRTIIGNSGNGYTMQVYITTSGYLTFGNTGSTFLQGSTDLADNAWHHFAIARKGTGTNEIAMWIDGVRVAQGTNSQNYTSGTIFLGSFDASNGFWNGYLSNLRIVKGTAVYDASNSTITVPTSPLTAIANTSLLTCQSNRFIDNSINQFAITRNGDTSVQPFSPFEPDAAYSTTSVGGSAYLDGSGDYLTISNPASLLTFGTGDFTIECFVYPTAASSASYVCWIYGTTTVINAIIINSNTGAVTFRLRGTNLSETDVTSSSGLLRVGEWTHLALVRTGTNFYGYVNGTRFSTTIASNAAFNEAQAQFFTQPQIGAKSNTVGDYFTGYVSGWRALKGTALYTSAFTPPTAPLTAIANTSALLNSTNAGITDAAAKNVLETVGNAQVTTAQSKFGGSAMLFDGTGDYVVQPTSSSYGYGTGNFTIEFWLYLNTTSLQTIVSNLSSGTSTNPHLYINGTIRYFTASADRITGASLNITTWYHIAVCRVSGSTRLFINGTQSGSTYADANNYGTTAPLGIGTYWVSGVPYTLTTLSGYIQDLRISKVGRYSGNFTPPTQAFPVQ